MPITVKVCQLFLQQREADLAFKIKMANLIDLKTLTRHPLSKGSGVFNSWVRNKKCEIQVRISLAEVQFVRKELQQQVSTIAAIAAIATIVAIAAIVTIVIVAIAAIAFYCCYCAKIKYL